MTRSRTALSLLVLGLMPVALGGGSCSSPDAGWVLVWSDEFDGAANTPPDPAHWNFDVGGNGWGNQQLEYNTDRVENVSHDGEGNLRITARREEYRGNEYTSGRITTSGKFSQALGRFEARIRLPIGRGLWPAFWMLGNDFDTVGWPECGEIDIMEYRGQQPFRVHGSLHGPGYSGGGAVTGSYDTPDRSRLSDDFHVFAIEWTADRITWILDDVRYRTVRIQDLPPGRRWVFDHGFFLILNVAVGGTFVGPPDSSTRFPQVMLVDYVRAYRRG